MKINYFDLKNPAKSCKITHEITAQTSQKQRTQKFYKPRQKLQNHHVSLYLSKPKIGSFKTFYKLAESSAD